MRGGAITKFTPCVNTASSFDLWVLSMDVSQGLALNFYFHLPVTLHPVYMVSVYFILIDKPGT